VVEQVNDATFPADGRLHVVRRGRGATVVVLGPVLDAVLAATADRDVSVLYSSTVRPFDATTLAAVVGAQATPDVVLVEPWLAGTSARVVADALRDHPHRLLSLGVARTELRRYGTPADHVALHGLDATGLRRSIDSFLTAGTQVRMTA
jgi:transketolase